MKMLRRAAALFLCAAVTSACAACGALTRTEAPVAQVSETFTTPAPATDTPAPTAAPETPAPTPEPELILPEDAEGLYVSETGDFALALPEGVLAVNSGTTLDDLTAQGYDEDTVAWLFDDGGPADGESEFLFDTETYGLCFMRTSDGYGITRAQMPELEERLRERYSAEGEGLVFDGMETYGGNPFWVMHWSGDGAESVLCETVCDGAGVDLCFTFLGMGEDMARTLLETLIVR